MRMALCKYCLRSGFFEEKRREEYIFGDFVFLFVFYV